MATGEQLQNLARKLAPYLRPWISSPFYEEGSFVPTLVGGGTAGTFTYDTNATKVEWARIGNRLFVNGRLSITAIAVAPTGNMTIRTFPYDGVADSNMAIAGVCEVEWQTNLSTAHTQMSGQFAAASANMTLVKSGDNLGLAAVIGTDIAIVGAAVEFRFGGHYRVG